MGALSSSLSYDGLMFLCISFCVEFSVYNINLQNINLSTCATLFFLSRPSLFVVAAVCRLKPNDLLL